MSEFTTNPGTCESCGSTDDVQEYQVAGGGTEKLCPECAP